MIQFLVDAKRLDILLRLSTTCGRSWSHVN